MTKNVCLHVLLLCLLVTLPAGSQTLRPDSDTTIILIPPTGEKAYTIAGEAFANMWEKVTGKKASIYHMGVDNSELPQGKIILIGSDAVNPAVHGLIRSGVIESLDIQYGSDDYRILSIRNGEQPCLVVAGGTGRSTIYAVYDFFRKQAGVEYFWDGDVIPKRDEVTLTGLNVLEQPRFQYRGLRYFAHRGLHRFQAEHWDLEDWKTEIDWLMKKRFNIFMLRTGIDDLFQRAFPEDVPYPPVDGQDPDAKQRSYDDRTSFWQLRYRGELRKQVLQYARDRGLLHPEDVGTITHWYSHTPSSFYRSKPDFPVITNQRSGYSLPTQAIWDIQSQEAWDAYWKLTETHIREFGGGSPRMFHTIGMAERVFGQSDRENLQSKLYVYRKTQQRLREYYPDAPLLIGSWDFIGWNWTDEGVQNLIKQFNSEKTILLDYTADKNDKATYRDWNVYEKFPWIFGIFHSLAKNSDIHEDYNILTPRLKDAANDSKCVGLVTWSEISHSDTYLLEYFADNSWQPQRLDIKEATQHFSETRYPQEIAQSMNEIWSSFLPISQTLHWGFNTILFGEPQFRILTSGSFINLSPEVVTKLDTDYRRVYDGLKQSPDILKKLALLANNNFNNSLWQRDALDMSRTIASRALFAAHARGAIQMEEWRNHKAEIADIRKVAELTQDLLSALSDILAMSDDFSMHSSLQRLYDAKPINGLSPMVNPHAEQTMKGNAENNYCRSHHFELVQNVYQPELKAYWNWVFKRLKSGDRAPWKRPSEFIEQKEIIEDRFYDTSLSEMAPTGPRNAKELIEILTRLDKLVSELVSDEL